MLTKLFTATRTTRTTATTTTKIIIFFALCENFFVVLLPERLISEKEITVSPTLPHLGFFETSFLVFFKIHNAVSFEKNRA